MPLLLQVTDLNGAAITGGGDRPLPVRTPSEPQITIPVNDSRTGQVTVSMLERIAPALQVAQTAVKVLYVNPKGDDILVLNGHVLSKTDDFDAATTSVTLIDSTIRLKRRYLGYNHYSIQLGLSEAISDGNVNAATGGDFNGITSAYGIPLDGTGLRLILFDSSHGAADWPGGGFSSVPAMGIRYTPGTNSIDNANRQPLYGGSGVPPVGVTGFTADSDTSSFNLTNVDFTGAMWQGAGSPAITDILQYMALTDGANILPEYAQVVSASGTTIVMSAKPLLTVTGGTFTAEDAIYCQLSRGDCAYDDVTDMVQAQGAFELDYVPIDKTHTGFSGDAWVAGQMCELYTANRVGSDRSQTNADGNTPVVFVHGEGGFHLTHSPDANQLVTYDVQVGPGGPKDALDILNKVTVESNTVTTYGIWESWVQATSAGTGDSFISNELLNNRAQADLTAYQDPPQFVTAKIDRDQISGYCYGTDFFLGDIVTIYAQKGYVTVGPMSVRITEIGITQVDADGNCQLDLTMVPFKTTVSVVAPSGGGGGGGGGGGAPGDLATTGFHAITNYRTVAHDWDFTAGMPSPWGFNNGTDPDGYNALSIPTYFASAAASQDGTGAHIGIQPHGGGGYDCGWLDSNGGLLWTSGSYTGFEPAPGMRIDVYAQMPRFAGHTNAAGIWPALPWVRGMTSAGADYQEVDGYEATGDNWTQLYTTLHRWLAAGGQTGGSPWAASPYPASVTDLSSAPYVISLVWEPNSPASTGPQVTTGINGVAVAQKSGLPSFFASVPASTHNKLVCNLAANPGGVFGGSAFSIGNNGLLPVYATITRIQVLTP